MAVGISSSNSFNIYCRLLFITVYSICPFMYTSVIGWNVEKPDFEIGMFSLQETLSVKLSRHEVLIDLVFVQQLVNYIQCLS